MHPSVGGSTENDSTSSASQVCTRCVMDTSAKEITFADDGTCSFCAEFLTKRNLESKAIEPARFADMVKQIKLASRGKAYDCVIGVSGGVDSSYVLLLAVRHGLKPLAVHLDNGWNSELAAHNITNLVKRLGVDLYTHVIDWPENRDLQRSFFRAHVVDIELLMDNAMLALNYRQAATIGVKHILTGDNIATEGVRMPQGWYQHKFDARNIRRIQRQFGTVPIRTHPLLSTLGWVWYGFVRGIRRVRPLDLVSYDKQSAIDELQREVGYKPYTYKHYESVFTRFYQAYILPRKFGIDKRRVHLSTLVLTRQMTRASALELLASSPYPDPSVERQDYTYVLKKLGFTNQEFEEYMAAPGVSHLRYGSEIGLNNRLLKVYKFYKGL